MKLEFSDINRNIKERCIACLKKSTNMQNLNDDVEKRTFFTNFFNVELADFVEYPSFLCSTCDVKLNISYNFQESVRKCIAQLRKYNDRIKEPIVDHEPVPDVDIEKDTHTRCNDMEQLADKNEIQELETEQAQERKVSKIQSIPLDLVNEVIERFRITFAEKKTCVLCGFIAANRRAISSHMAVIHKEEKSNWCLECNNIFKDYEEHKKTHSKKYECPFCNKQTNSYQYVEHLQSHAGIFECDICNKTFKSAAWLSKHKRIHRNDKPYVCPNCSKSFIQSSSLKYHIRTHGKFSCESCKKRYKTRRELEGHECTGEQIFDINEIWIQVEGSNNDASEERISIVQSGLIDSEESQNFCKNCNKRVKSLRQHINKYHTLTQLVEGLVVEDLRCEYCDRKYSNSHNLKVHMRTHMEVLPYKCKYCNKGLLNRTRLKDHERTHTKEKPFICNICGKAFSQSSSLNTHMRQHTGRPEVCELCDKRFCRKAELQLHLSKHRGEKPFLCTECGKAFAQKSHLTEHMAGHGEARPFQCSYCQKAFKKNLLLKEHVKLHQGHKSFKCPLCSYACYKAYRLQQHMKQHSEDLPGNTEQNLEINNY